MNLAFHNDPTLAATVRAQVEAHTAADEIIQGEYWEDGKGCFIGCIAHGRDPVRVMELTGFPTMLTRIAESIFEGLPNDIAKGFPQRVINAPRIGADLSLVAWKFLHWTVSEALALADTATQFACQPALDVVARNARGETVSAVAAADAANAAARAADAAYASAYAAVAAADAANAAARAAYADAAADAAGAAADAAADASYADAYADAAADAAGAAAYAAARIKQADKFIELLEAAQ